MNRSSRRSFLRQSLRSSALAFFSQTVLPLSHFTRTPNTLIPESTDMHSTDSSDHDPIDFRFSPPDWQSTFCFPDDAFKSLVGKHGDVRYGHPGLGGDIDDFAHRVSFGFHQYAMEYVEQHLESPAIPIVHTRMKCNVMEILLTTFATNMEKEGRFDNVTIAVNRITEHSSVYPVVTIQSKRHFKIRNVLIEGKTFGEILLDDDSPFCSIDSEIEMIEQKNGAIILLKSFAYGQYTFLLRFPQEKQKLSQTLDGMPRAETLLTHARSFWKAWSPTTGNVSWKLHTEHDAFFTACARNIVQSRAIKEEKKAFQVGPTCYRGLWVIDGNFLLEAARYMGFDQEAQDGLESLWVLQREDGGIFAGGGETHWKDTAATMYATARQADLSQDWKFFASIIPNARRGVRFLRSLRDNARDDGSANGRYGILPRGFGDRGIGGVRSELANTLWTVFALKGFLDVVDRLHRKDCEDVRLFYHELNASLGNAVREELRTHEGGFTFLPMLMKEDSRWNDPDPMKRPKVQAAQVYMSHAIYPGLMWEKNDPLVRGHIELMQAITKENIPAETGWLANDAVWAYNAPIAAQVYLWAGMRELARKTFDGFLHHASPLYAWREEQSLQGTKPFRFIGDMPHNWASAECIRFLRHIFILEDKHSLRLLDGIIADDLVPQKPLALTYSPTKWGRVSIALEPLDSKSWKASFRREDFNQESMATLSSVELPFSLSEKLRFREISGAKANIVGDRLMIEPDGLEWQVIFGEKK